jgi:5-methylcytosine-specific restriction protein A
MAATPQSRLRQLILRALLDFDEYGGRRADVLAAIEGMGFEWTAEDVMSPHSRPFESRWRNSASYEFADMRREGLAVPDWGDGVWALTRAGVRAAESLAEVAWDILPGTYLSREERRRRFGGSTYGGIEPSVQTPNVFVYSDPSAGAEYGYNFDGWAPDGSMFLYTGEGRRGDQTLREGNRAVAQHVEQGRALRVFVADGLIGQTQAKNQRYVGEFRVDPNMPFVRSEAADVDGVDRVVLVFRLLPVGDVWRRDGDESEFAVPEPDRAEVEEQPGAEEALLENDAGLPFMFGAREAGIALRRETALVNRFESLLHSRGHRTSRYRVRPRGQLRPLFTDLYDHTDRILYEAKASATRECVRMAIGQLLDYRRYVPINSRASLLLPSCPAPDLLELIADLGLGCVVEADDQPGSAPFTVVI